MFSFSWIYCVAFCDSFLQFVLSNVLLTSTVDWTANYLCLEQGALAVDRWRIFRHFGTVQIFSKCNKTSKWHNRKSWEQSNCIECLASPSLKILDFSYLIYKPSDLNTCNCNFMFYLYLWDFEVDELRLGASERKILTHWGRGHLNCLNARSRGFELF